MWDINMRILGRNELRSLCISPGVAEAFSSETQFRKDIDKLERIKQKPGELLKDCEELRELKL